ncbi:ATP synthase F1 subunit delta [Candidatus Aminicenantes bacterium AC-335-A11]|jgi:F-type H+-transporting ATPase subunit delta|nr:ATP synthase F1 subunit delta [SCandidatus Aminicenantes bacterium Aminicenantia_JdfR_composite]MCP2596421.1 ATP synthase F1 subunit delta [Candidatus Aminicenantes bacterium AC-335-G13]MCP2606184.1 ATP synthase F1 subunit delta [Candidatus Aminicenantes bacterium AC-708-I09]MCP2618201.1 ATP synthase F1 subunit delta [Candidatus Aminicenantes bacterium AC-335-A11]MCP2621000.1 ATP synthase F1 subunit delta [Candidatus Aminicenantes bacterium AC-334-E05]
MRIQIIAKRYAMGMVRAIESDEEYNRINQELKKFVELIERDGDFKKFISSPFYSYQQKRKVLHQILEKIPFSEKSKRFFLLLIEKNRLLLLPEIIELIKTYWYERKNIHTFEVISAYPLTEEQKERLRRKLKEKVKAEVEVKYKIDNSLIGGLIIKKGDILYDGSIKGNLLKLKEKILGEE